MRAQIKKIDKADPQIDELQYVKKTLNSSIQAALHGSIYRSKVLYSKEIL